MVSIPDKTLEDLEYDEVLKHCSAFSITPMGKEVVLSLRPLNKADEVLNRLKMTSEYCSSFDNENRIPNHEFDDISSYFQRHCGFVLQCLLDLKLHRCCLEFVDH